MFICGRLSWRSCAVIILVRADRGGGELHQALTALGGATATSSADVEHEFHFEKTKPTTGKFAHWRASERRRRRRRPHFPSNSPRHARQALDEHLVDGPQGVRRGTVEGELGGPRAEGLERLQELGIGEQREREFLGEFLLLLLLLVVAVFHCCCRRGASVVRARRRERLGQWKAEAERSARRKK